MTQPYRILLVEDHVIFREVIRNNLQGIPGLEIVGEAGDGLELLKSVETLKPQMIILDLSLPHVSGLEAAQKIKQQHPEMKILVLTMHKSKDHLARATEAGVDGYLAKDDAFDDLLKAIELIRGGNFYISKSFSQQLLENFYFQKGKSTAGERQSLSPKELQILKYFTEGKSKQEIAELLSLSEKSVSNYLFKIKNKLLIKTDIELMRYAIIKGYAHL